jgi:hypothetical protein
VPECRNDIVPGIELVITKVITTGSSLV